MEIINKCIVCRTSIASKTKRSTDFQRKYCSVECAITKHTKKTSFCWEWTGPKCKDGYGLIRIPGTRTTRRVTRVITDCPKGLVVMHSCDEPSCVNPSHLIIGTVEQNNKDKKKKNRDKKGLEVKCAKLSNKFVKTIYKSNKLASELSIKYGVSKGAIYGIKKGRTHSWLTGAIYNRKSRSKCK